jgi:hypothetical protein
MIPKWSADILPQWKNSDDGTFIDMPVGTRTLYARRPNHCQPEINGRGQVLGKWKHLVETLTIPNFILFYFIVYYLPMYVLNCKPWYIFIN